MDILIYAAAGAEGGERALAYRLLERALAWEFRLSPPPEIAREPGGKPYFPSRPDLHFNLSHSHGAAVCALHHKPVGVDVEKLRPAPRRLAGGMADEAFFRLWTAKEATIKRQGRGLSALLSPLEPDPLCRCLEGLLEGYVITVCPSEAGTVRTVVL